MSRCYRVGQRLALCLALCAVAVAHGAPGLTDFHLTDFQGQPRGIEDYAGKGRWLIVMFWASDCHVCNAEVYQYVDFQDVHAGDDAEILGITLDGAGRKAAAEGFVARHHVNFPNLIGEPRDVAALYRGLTGESFSGTPTFLVFDPQGMLRGRQVGAVPTSVIEMFIQQESAQTKAGPSGPGS